jgi:ABC-type uncharacterized transport system involved in gliding motility auxiliary subunit
MKNWLFPLWVIIDVLVFLSVIALWIAAPEYRILNWGLTVFAVTLAVLLLIIRQKDIRVFVKSRYFERVAFHVINSVLVISIVGMLNYLGNKNFKDFDLTSSGKNSLTEQTLKVLDMVKSPLKFTVFAKREEWAPILMVLKMYQAKSPLIKIEAIDTDVRPDLVKQKEISQNGTVLVEYKGKESKFIITDELSITNALLKALRDEKFVLYFVTGHQELSCDEKSAEGISVLCERLLAQNYGVKTLNLAATKEVPRDATAVFILGPVSGFFPEEASRVADYLARGGSVFLALAPAFKSEMYDNLVKLAHPYGLTMGKDIVIDRLSTVQGAEATVPIIQNYSSEHPITAGFNLRTVFPLSSSVKTLQGNDSAVIIAKTSDFPGSWAESDLAGVTKGKAEFKEKEDVKGPIGVMGVGEKVGGGTISDSRFVLLGSSSFLVNAYQGQTGNTTLFLNSVSWLMNDEGIISLNRPGMEEPPVILSAQHLQMIFVISILLVPIVFFGAAIFIYRRRRIL